MGHLLLLGTDNYLWDVGELSASQLHPSIETAGIELSLLLSYLQCAWHGTVRCIEQLRETIASSRRGHEIKRCAAALWGDGQCNFGNMTTQDKRL